MDNILVVVFDNESKAYEGSVALDKLHDQGVIDLCSKAVMVRSADGKAHVKQSSDPGPVGTVLGLMTGTLIGLFGGVAGFVIGVGVGTSGGFLYDMAHLGVSQDFLDEVGESLKPGRAAVVAEIWEDKVMPVDTKMEALGGVVFCTTRRDSLDRQIEWDINRLKAEIDELETERDRASGGAKAKLQAKMDTAKARLHASLDRSRVRLETSQQEIEAKIQSLREQAAKARAEQKAKLEQRIAELKAEQKRRNEQLKQKVEDFKETLAV